MKKILSLILSVLLLSSSFVACAQKPAEDLTDTSNDSESEVTIDTTVDPTALPATNMDGFIFRAFVRSGEENERWKCIDIYAEDATSDDIANAVFERNGRLYDLYNFYIEQTESGATSLTEARNLIASGDTTHHALCLSVTNTATLAAERSLLDLLAVPYLQLEMPWWDVNTIRDLSIGGRLFFTTGDLSISCGDALQVPVFNKTVMANQDGMENPYQLVRDGKWTVDKMLEMAKLVNDDSNGDGVMDVSDTWGYLAYAWGALFLYFGAGETIVTKNADDLPELSLQNERAQLVIDKLYAVQGGANPDVFNGWSDDQTLLMSEDRVLFTITSLENIRTQFRESVESDFGVLPTPKFDEEQEEYHNLVTFYDTANMYSIPNSCPDIEKTGFVLEALAQESTDTLREAYYDKVISYKAMRDAESLEMLELIFSTRIYDLTLAFAWGGWDTYFTTFSESNGVNRFSSVYRKSENKTLTAIADTIAKFTSVQE